jgi:hypothetical protein
LRSLREPPETPRTVVLAATDPANPYGAILRWPELPNVDGGRGPTRTVGALVIVVDGAAAGYLRRGERELLLFVPDAEPRRSQATREVARMLLHLARHRGMLIAEINGGPALAHPSARLFIEQGFVATAMGLQARTDAIRPRGYGTAIAAASDGGQEMADQNRMEDDPTLIGNSRPREKETSETEHDRARNSNDRDQQMEREGIQSEHNRGYDEAARGRGREDVDPDSAMSDVDRDDLGEA